MAAVEMLHGFTSVNLAALIKLWLLVGVLQHIETHKYLTLKRLITGSFGSTVGYF